MDILNLEQGSKEWLDKRLECFTASEAPILMGASKFMSRSQLLDLKKGWQSNPNDNSFRERLFEKGHLHEAMAREHIEFELMRNIPPVVGARKFRGIKTLLLASFDGFDADPLMIWEHKDWNEQLAENVRNSVLEPHYYWQLEHQALVADAKEIMFTVSDGTLTKRVTMIYKSVPERRKELIAATKQFEKDLEAHELSAKDSQQVEAAAIHLPAVSCQVDGSNITSNLPDVIKAVRDIAQIETNKTLETDLDFVEKDNLNKAVKAAREQLKEKAEIIKNGFADYAEFSRHVDELDSILQKLQSDGERKVKSEKDRRKKAIANDGLAEINAFVAEQNKLIQPLSIDNIIRVSSNLDSAMKNKRTIDSLVEAVSVEVARVKTEISTVVEQVKMNLEWFRSGPQSGFDFLFNDINQVINQPLEPFQAVVKVRISDYERAQQNKAQEATPQQAPVQQEQPGFSDDLLSPSEPPKTESKPAAPAMSDAVHVIDFSDDVITFSDGHEFPIPSFKGDGPFTVVEKLAQLQRTIVNKYKV